MTFFTSFACFDCFAALPAAGQLREIGPAFLLFCFGNFAEKGKVDLRV